MTGLLLLLWLAFIALEVLRSWYVIAVRGYKPIYNASVILRLSVASIMLYLFHPRDAYTFAALLIYQATSFWVVYDLSLNIATDREFFYTDTETGILDRFGNRPLLYLLLKLAAVALCVVSIYYIYGQ